MEIYFAPGACSMASHIALNEADIDHKMHKVDLKTHTFDEGQDYYKVNPKGQVPMIKMDNGEQLTENAIILQYVSDIKPELGLMPQAGTMERYHAMEWLNFISTEIHKKFGPFFNPKATEEQKEEAKKILTPKYEIAAKALNASEYLMGKQATAPDFYLFVMLRWAKNNDIDLSKFPSLTKFYEKMLTRPSVIKTMEMEGLKH